jgi:hypothetical protein
MLRTTSVAGTRSLQNTAATEQAPVLAGALLRHHLQTQQRSLVQPAPCTSCWLLLLPFSCNLLQACNRMSYVCVPLYETLGEDAIEYILEHSEARMVVVAGKRLGRMAAALKQVDKLAGVVYWGEAAPADLRVSTCTACGAQGACRTGKGCTGNATVLSGANSSSSSHKDSCGRTLARTATCSSKEGLAAPPSALPRLRRQTDSRFTLVSALARGHPSTFYHSNDQQRTLQAEHVLAVDSACITPDMLRHTGASCRLLRAQTTR